MSTRQLSLVFSSSASRGSSRLLLLAMADEAHDDGSLIAYRRSQSYLAKKAGVSLPALRRAIDDLVALGELEVLKVGTGRVSSDYRITIEGAQSEPPRLASPVDLTGQGVQDEGAGVPPATGPSSRSLPVPPTSPPSAPSEPLASIERAKALVTDWWEWVRARTGKPPIEVKYMQLAKMLVGPIEAGFGDEEITRALRRMFANKRYFNPANIAQELDGRARQAPVQVQY